MGNANVLALKNDVATSFLLHMGVRERKIRTGSGGERGDECPRKITEGERNETHNTNPPLSPPHTPPYPSTGATNPCKDN